MSGTLWQERAVKTQSARQVAGSSRHPATYVLALLLLLMMSKEREEEGTRDQRQTTTASTLRV